MATVTKAPGKKQIRKKYDMKFHRIKNKGRTGARVLLFLILAVTPGFVPGCQSCFLGS